MLAGVGVRRGSGDGYLCPLTDGSSNLLMTARNPLAPPLSGALRALPYPRGGASESRLFTHRDIGDHAPDGPANQDTRVNTWTWAFSGQLSVNCFYFLACCFSITRSRWQVATQPPNAHVYCSACPRAVCNVVADAESVPVPAFGPRMVCTGCGIIGADVRPNWQERSARASITGMQWR